MRSLLLLSSLSLSSSSLTRRGRTGPGGRSTAASRQRPRRSSRQPGTCEPCPASGGSSARSAGKYLTAAENICCVLVQVWGCGEEELLVSMDGLIVWRPWRLHQDRRPGASSLHTDQNPAGKQGYQCVQVNISSVFSVIIVFIMSSCPGHVAAVPGDPRHGRHGGGPPQPHQPPPAPGHTQGLGQAARQGLLCPQQN